MTHETRVANAKLKPAVHKSATAFSIWEVIHTYINPEFSLAEPHETSFDDIEIIVMEGRKYFFSLAECQSYCNEVNELKKEIK